MSSSDRRHFLALLALLPAAACGFEPVYGTSGPGQVLVDQVRADDPTDKNGFDLVERLEERLGRTRVPVYRLSYAISTSTRGLAITQSNATTRYNIDGEVEYQLISDQTGTVVASGKVATFVSYSASGTMVSTVSARDDAYERLMRLLADQIVNELIASSGRWSGR